MSQDQILLPRPLIFQLLQHAQSSPEAEICGLIGARDGQPSRCYPIQNAAEASETRFELDPAQQIEAMRAMRDAGETLFAIFHSHPRAPAEPSPTDVAMAGYPEALHIIISLNTKGVLEMRGFRIDDTNNVNEVELILEQN